MNLTRFFASFFLAGLCFSLPLAAQGPLTLDDFFAKSKTLGRWETLPAVSGVLTQTAEPLSISLVSCETVRADIVEAESLWDLVLENNRALYQMLKRVEGLSPEELNEVLRKTETLKQEISQSLARLKELSPARYQTIDRIQKFEWKIEANQFPVHSSDYDVTIEWIQFAVHDGPAFGEFEIESSNHRPFLKRIDSLIEKATPDEADFLKLLRHYAGQTMNTLFKESSPFHTSQVSAAGANTIRLEQRVSPIEACLPNPQLTGAALIDFAIEEKSTGKSSYRMGMGPLILMMSESN